VVAAGRSKLAAMRKSQASMMKSCEIDTLNLPASKPELLPLNNFIVNKNFRVASKFVRVKRNREIIFWFDSRRGGQHESPPSVGRKELSIFCPAVPEPELAC
jgi:hypothetical protein